MSFSSMRLPDWILASKDLTLGAKVLLARMVVLSRDGQQAVYVRRSDVSKWFGISVRAVSGYFAELLQGGFVTEIPNPDPWSRAKNFEIADKALTVDLQDLQHREGKNSNVDSAEVSTREGNSCHMTLQDLQCDPADSATSLLDQKQINETKGETESEPTPSHPAQTFLQSADEVMTKMGEWINKHRMRHPVLDSVDLPMEADGLYLKYRTKKVDLEALVDAWMRQLVTAREAKAKVVYQGKAPVMSIREGVNKDRAELERMFGAVNEIQTQCLEVKDDA